MAKHDVSRMVPSLFHPELAARNGRLPNAAIFARLARTYNQLATVQRKLIFLKSQDWRNMESPVSSPTTVWSFYFRTGENVSAVVCRAGVTKTTSIFPGIPSQIIVDVYRASDDVRMNIDSEGSIRFGGTTSGSIIGPDNVSHHSFVISGLAPNTEYYSETRCLFGGRLAYLSVAERRNRNADDSISVVCNPALFVREGPITAAQLADLANAAKLLWRHNASHLFSWCSNYAEDTVADPVSFATIYTDLITANAAMNVEATGRGTLQRPNAIPVKMAVKARRTAGAGTADFRLTNGIQSIDILGAAITSTAAWFTGTGTLIGSPSTYQMQHRVSVNTTTVRTMAWSLFQFEA